MMVSLESLTTDPIESELDIHILITKRREMSKANFERGK